MKKPDITSFAVAGGIGAVILAFLVFAFDNANQNKNNVTLYLFLGAITGVAVQFVLRATEVS